VSLEFTASQGNSVTENFQSKSDRIFLELIPFVEEPGFAGVGRQSLFVPHPVPL